MCLCHAQLGWFRGDHKGNKKASDEGFLGVVASKSLLSFTIVATDSRVITFKITDSTIFQKGNKGESPYDMSRGETVRVYGTADREGNLTATNIRLQDSSVVPRRRAQASGLLPGGVKDDRLVQRARDASDAFFAMLPNFLCQQSTTRSYGGADQQWHTVDKVTAEVLYNHHHESYRDVKLNGKATGHSMMDLPGSRSTGEFGSTLRALFDKDTETLFKFRANASLRNYSAAIYDFAVSGDKSDWRITAGSQMIATSYTGKIWIDRESGNVIRLEMKAVDIPAAFPFQRVEAAVDYGPVELPAGRYFLPEWAENVSCNDPKTCSRNVIEFRNYHKYIGETSITFDGPDGARPQ
ncbi:MAG TPA: DUF5666 domain-containing protein [Bryobacteraceae bacterium]